MNKLFILLIFLLLSAFCNSQTSVNPDISAVGTFNTFTNFVKGTAEYGKLNFQIPDMELYVEGYLNPYTRNICSHCKRLTVRFTNKSRKIFSRIRKDKSYSSARLVFYL